MGVIYKRVLFGGIIIFLLITMRRFMGVLGDHDCESTLLWLIFGLEVKSCVCGKGLNWNTMMV